MKYTRTIFALSVIPLLCAHTAFADESELSNWTYRAASDKENGYKLSIDQKVFINGKPAASIQSTKRQQDARKFYAAPFQSFNAAPLAGKRVRFSASVKAENVQGSAGLWLKAKAGERVIAFNDMESNAIKGTADWTKESITVDLPQNTDDIAIGVWMTGGGQIWFGDLELNAIDPKHSRLSTKQVWDPQQYWRFDNELRKEPNFTLSDSISDEEQQKNWTCHTSKSPSKCGIDHTEKLHGKPSSFIEQQANDPTDYVSSFQDIAATNYAGKKVKFTAHVKTKAVTDWTGLWMRVDSGHSVLAFDNMEDRPIKGDTDWKEHSIVLDVPQSATRIRLGFMQAGSGKSWLNDAKLEIVAASK